MKKNLKLLLAITITFSVLSFPEKTLAEEFVKGSKCPASPDPSLSSICGTVVSSLPEAKTLSDGTSIEVPSKGIEGVTVYLYECDNSSPSCKNNGDITHPFASTLTNIDGRFHMLMRKLDNPVTLNATREIEVVGSVVQSKRRYLIFLCANEFAGIQVIPSYMDLTNILQEVKCPSASGYKTPPDKFTIPGPRLANQTGYGDEKEELLKELNYPDSYLPGDPSYVPHLTTQVYWKEFQPTQNINLDIKLEEADPRFLPHTENDGIDEANKIDKDANRIETAAKDSSNGAWWSLDCFEKYKGDDMRRFCMDNKIATATDATGAATSYITTGDRDLQIQEYQRELYENFDFLRQMKLSNIPPYNDILFYKELPARQDITNFKQDITSVASFNGTQFSNCIGDVFLRKENENKPSLFPECITFQVCNGLTNNYSYLNRYTQGGPGSGFSNLYNLKKEYIDNLDLNTPVCKINPLDVEEDPIRVGEIQPPWDLNSGDYRLDSSYWNNEFIYYYGKNTTAKYGLHFNCVSGNCSYPEAQDPSSINKFPFTALTEAGLSNEWAYNGGTSVQFSNDAKNPNNSVATAAYLSGINAPNNWVSSPYKDEMVEKRIVTGKAKVGVGIGRPMNLNKWSEINGPLFLEDVDTSAQEDAKHYRNDFAPGNKNHYPFDDFGYWGILDGVRTYIAGAYDALQTLIGTSTNASSISLGQTQNYALATGNMVITNPQNSSQSNIYNVSTGKIVSSVDEFNEKHKTQILAYNTGDATKEAPDEDADKMRPPTSAIWLTSAAIHRLLALGVDPTGKEKSYAAHDLYDSLLSTLYGEGKLDFGSPSIQEKMARVFSYFTEGALKNSILGLFGINTDLDNKSFLDRLNEDNLGPAGSVDSLKTSFSISESTFMDEFPLPIPGGLDKDGKLIWLLPDDWGGKSADAKACYPWYQMTLGKTCGTADTESDSKVSRTCQVNKCYKTTTTAICTCSRGDKGDEEFVTKPIATPDFIVTCPDVDDAVVNLASKTNPEDECNQPNPDDMEWRLTLAQRQKTCVSSQVRDGQGIVIAPYNEKSERECIRETYEGEIKDVYKKMEENAGYKYCNASNFNGSPGPVDITQTIDTPQGIVSRAGPFSCAGILERDAELKIESEKLNYLQDAVPLDAIKVADNELTQAFQAPSCNKIVYSPAAFISADSSIRDSTLPDIAKNMDTTGLGGYSALIRQMFSMPKKIDSPLNPAYYHCLGTTLGGTGSWDCTIREAPKPEEVDIYSLPAENTSCNLNPSVECSNLVFGENYESKNEKIYPNCSAYTPTNFNSTFNNFSEGFIKVVNSAASRFNIPASVLLAYMQGIGNLQKYNYYWSDFGGQSLYDISAPWYGTLDDCDDMNTAAQGPFDWLLVWFNFSLKNIGGGGAPGSAVDKDGKSVEEVLNGISYGRGSTASRCNFLDAVYVAAATLSGGSTTECSQWTWGLASTKLMDMTYGTDRVGDYAKATTYNAGTAGAAVFEACRYNYSEY